jgi:hypothetical protein
MMGEMRTREEVSRDQGHGTFSERQHFKILPHEIREINV